MRKLVATLMLLVLIGQAGMGVELSTSVYPTEDELLEALRSGEIGPTRFLELRDILYRGIDSASEYLWDEVPNLDVVRSTKLLVLTALQREQRLAFQGSAKQQNDLSGYVRSRVLQELSGDSRYRLRTSARIITPNRLEARFQFDRNLARQTRVVERSLRYKQRKGWLREVILGSFSRRLGLGSVYGYRGRIAVNDNNFENSLLYPDFGGNNGIYASMRFQSVQAQLLASRMQYIDHTITATGATLARKGRLFDISGQLGYSRVSRRHSSNRFEMISYAINSQHRYRSGQVQFEITRQAGEATGWSALLFEGSHSFRQSQIIYAGWSYADRFIGLTAGGKSGHVSRLFHLPSVDLSYRDRRRGQEGGLLKTVVDLTSRWSLANAFLYSSVDADSSRFQWLSAIMNHRSTGLSWRLDHLLEIGQSLPFDASGRRHRSRTRLELRYHKDKLAFRAFVGYTTKPDMKDYMSAFVRVRLTTISRGEFELWSNVSRLALESFSIDRWYAYVRVVQQFISGMSLSLKLSNAYRSGDTADITTAAVEATWRL